MIELVGFDDSFLEDWIFVRFFVLVAVYLQDRSIITERKELFGAERNELRRFVGQFGYFVVGYYFVLLDLAHEFWVLALLERHVECAPGLDSLPLQVYFLLQELSGYLLVGLRVYGLLVGLYV